MLFCIQVGQVSAAGAATGATAADGVLLRLSYGTAGSEKALAYDMQHASMLSLLP